MSVWMVYKVAFGGDYRTPVNTYGPFKDKLEAEAWAAEHDGTAYDHSALSFADRELLGIYD